MKSFLIKIKLKNTSLPFLRILSVFIVLSTASCAKKQQITPHKTTPMHFHIDSVHVTLYRIKHPKTINAVFLNALHPVYNPQLSKMALKLAISSTPEGYTENSWKEAKKEVSFRITSSTQGGWESIGASWNAKYSERGLILFLKTVSSIKFNFSSWKTLASQEEINIAEKEQKPSFLFETGLKFLLAQKTYSPVSSLSQLQKLDFFAVRQYAKNNFTQTAHALFITGNLSSSTIIKYIRSVFKTTKIGYKQPFWFPPPKFSPKPEVMTITLPLQEYSLVSCGFAIPAEEYEFWKYVAKYYASQYAKLQNTLFNSSIYLGPLPYVILTWYGNSVLLKKQMEQLHSYIYSDLFFPTLFSNYRKYALKLQKSYSKKPDLILNKLIFNFKYGLIGYNKQFFADKIPSRSKAFLEWKKLLKSAKCVMSSPSGFQNIKPFTFKLSTENQADDNK